MGSNWSAPEAFKTAIGLADEVHQTDVDHRGSLIRALVCTASLVEHWRGPHKEEVNAHLESYRPDLAKGVAKGDEILAVVKCLFHNRKQDHSWYANAMRQAFADKVKSDDMTVYFTTEAPTARATKWRQDHRKPPNQPALKSQSPVSWCCRRT